LSRTKKLVVDDDGRIVSHELPDVGTLDHSSPACFLIPLVVQGFHSKWWPIRDCGHRPLRESPAQAVIEDEYIVIDDPKKDALLGVDGFLGPASPKAKRIEFDFDAKVLRWRFSLSAFRA